MREIDERDCQHGLADTEHTEIEKRLAELKPLGAGDAMCADCLGMKIEPLAVCKQCIADTPEFTKLMNSMCKTSVPN